MRSVYQSVSKVQPLSLTAQSCMKLRSPVVSAFSVFSAPFRVFPSNRVFSSDTQMTDQTKKTREFPEVFSEKEEKQQSIVPASNSFMSLKNKGLFYVSALPLVASVSEPTVSWTHMLGHAPSPYAEFLGVFPLGMFFILQMSPMQTMKTLQKNKSVGKMSPLPYITLGTNCVIWTVYGILNIDPTIAIANGMGALLSGYYTSVYAKYTTFPMTPYYAGAGAAFGATAVGAMLLPSLGMGSVNDVLGIAGNIMAISFFASPLAVMQTVLRDKSTAAMPFAVTAATTMNCIAWSSYGLLVAHDPYVIFPNLIGFGLAMAQLSLFARFGISKAPPISKV